MARSQRRCDTVDVCNEGQIKILTNDPFRHSTYLFSMVISCKKRLKAIVKLLYTILACTYQEDHSLYFAAETIENSHKYDAHNLKGNTFYKDYQRH